MKNTFFLFVLLLTDFLGQTSVCAQTITNKNNKESQILALVLKTLNEKHINPVKLDDAFSKKMFETFIDLLDSNRLFFYKSDIVEFKKYETLIDNQILVGDLSFVNLVKERYILRMNEGKEIYTDLLKNKLDFSKDKFDSSDIEKKQIFQENKFELTKLYKLTLRAILLNRIKESYNPNLTANEFLELVLKEEKNLTKIIEVTTLNIDNIPKEYVFQEFLTAIVSQFDKDSDYFAPTKRNIYLFKKTGKTNGVGISVGLRDNYKTIEKIIQGGSAYDSKAISPGDVILKIAQNQQQAINVTNLSLFDAMELTRGKMGSIVILTIKKSNGSIIDLPLKRKTVFNKDNFIKSALVEKNNSKYGILSFSDFYNFESTENLYNAPNDFNKEVTLLKDSNVTGIILDLRDNDGGTKEEVKKILDILSNIELTKKWNNRFVVLINSQTGSGAELITLVLKEKFSAVVLGEKSKGKRNINNLIDLNTLKENKSIESDFGSLLISTDEFYIPNQDNIPNTGIEPDINFTPTYLRAKTEQKLNLIENEKKFNNKIIKNTGFYKVIRNSIERLNKNKIYKSLIEDKFDEDLARINNLNYLEFKNDFDILLKKQDKSPLKSYSNNLQFNSIETFEKALEGKEYLIQKRKEWLQSLTNDFQIEEGVNILEDMNRMK